jgi:hypothetical protein
LHAGWTLIIVQEKDLEASARAAEQEAKAAWMGSEPVSFQAPLLSTTGSIESNFKNSWSAKVLKDREGDFVLER